MDSGHYPGGGMDSFGLPMDPSTDDGNPLSVSEEQGHNDQRLLHAKQPEEDDEETFHFKDVAGSPSKRKKIENMQPFKTTSDFGEKLSIELVQGGFELIGIEVESGRDGYFDPIRKAILGNDHSMKSYNLITVATRCKGPGNDDVLYNLPAPKAGKAGTMAATAEIRVFPRQYIVRAISVSNKKTRRAVVNHLAQWLNNEHRKTPPHGMTLAEWNRKLDMSRRERYVVPDDFDRTPALRNLCKLSDHLCARQIIKIIGKTYKNVTATWAKDNPQQAKMFFSRPYPIEAVKSLGYDNSTLFDHHDGADGADGAHALGPNT